MSGLRAEDFDLFYEAVHGYERFPWQRDLVVDVLERNEWPDVIDVPTGLGKTSLIDIAVFVAAVAGCAPGSPGRRRVFFAIDRRIVVDEAHAHACMLQKKLTAEDARPEVRRVREALDALHPGRVDDEPLTVERMRGGLTWEWRWLDRPDRPAVVVGTVDQLGSRALFGGYGLGPRLRPIDAALVALDSIFIVDEAQLAQPFVQTLKSIATMPMTGDLPFAPPLIVTMSATPPPSDRPSRVFPTQFRDAELSSVAAQRVYAKKRLYGVRVPKGIDASGVLAGYAAELFDPTNRIAAVGVVCNTVQRAREVATELRRNAQLSSCVRLLTGRIRPHDRDALVDTVTCLAGVERNRETSKPIIVVATQTIEVGANLDFDALVTESAPIDGLIQRLGRLNRLGEADGECVCVVVHEEVRQPLYAEARDNTWDVLTTALGGAPAATAKTRPALVGGIDASPDAMRRLVAATDRSALVVEPPLSPTLFPEVVADWASTSGGEALAGRDPFLHGFRDASDDVFVVWRADLDIGSAASDDWFMLVDRLPPVAVEQLEVPLRAVRRWLQRMPVDDDAADMPRRLETTDDDATPPPVADLATPVLVWRGPSDGVFATTGADLWRIRPGDVVVVPAAAGGCDAEGWAPGSRRPVDDIAEVAGDRPRPLVRIADATLPALLGTGASTDNESLRAELHRIRTRAEHVDEADVEEVVATELRALAASVKAGDVDGVAGADADAVANNLRNIAAGRLHVLRATDGRILGIHALRSIDRLHDEGRAGVLGDGSLADADPAASSATGRQVTLDAHHEAVSARARDIATALRLPAPVVESVAVAAGLHDLGKSDPRFQVVLNGGDVAAAEEGVLLAKSGMRPDERGLARRAWRASGLPRGYRHEVGSAQAVEELVDNMPEVDPELVIHLVASHHGNARPLLPAIRDRGNGFAAGGVDVDPRRSVDFEHPRRFRSLSDRYGHWGLAMLEAIVRLSDIGCSEEGS